MGKQNKDSTRDTDIFPSIVLVYVGMLDDLFVVKDGVGRGCSSVLVAPHCSPHRN